MDPKQKTIMVEGFIAAFAKAARVSDVPEEAITSDTREPSYMFLAAEWNRSTVSERAYLLAMLFGREFEVEANDFSLQIAGLAMMMLEPDGSPSLGLRIIAGHRNKLTTRITGSAEADGGFDMSGHALVACGKLQQITADICQSRYLRQSLSRSAVSR